MVVNEKGEKILTVREVFKEVLDNEKCIPFKFVFHGSLNAANPKTKKPCRVSIILPKEVVDTNLKDLDKWCLIGVAIPWEEIKD